MTVTTWYHPPGVVPGTTYYWRVDETDRDGVTVYKGDVWSFIAWPFTAFLPSPKDGSNTVHIATALKWLGGQGAVKHHLYLSDNEAGVTAGAAEADKGMVKDPNYVPGGLLPATVYFWRVDEISATGTVATPPVIDGKIDAAWSAASVQYVTTTVSGTAPTGPADASGSFRALYDAANLYVLVDVNDGTLVQDSDPAQGWLDDRVEVFIDGDNSKNAAQDGTNDYQYCFRWNHAVVEVPVEWYRPPDSLAGVQYGVAATSSGYLVEIKLPWSTMIGGPQQAGRLIGIDVIIDDDDDGGDMDSQIAWHLPSGDPHRPIMWGTALLAEVGPEPADRLYVALRDASNFTGVVTYPQADILKAKQWVQWNIPLADFAKAGVDLATVRKMFIGVGDRVKPVAGGAGPLFIDDIYLTRPAPTKN